MSTRTFLFWAAVLLALPACSSFTSAPAPDATTPDSGLNLVRGQDPRNGLIFCDVEIPRRRRCASADDKLRGVRLAEAAIALNQGVSNVIALDYSPGALGRCNQEPEAYEFEKPFPDGTPVCVNCSEVVGAGKANPTPAAVCNAHCLDLYAATPTADGTVTTPKPVSPEATAFCNERAKVSTNWPANLCLVGGCDNAGNDVRANFSDPRRATEPVAWTHFVNTASIGTEGASLTRTTPFTGDYDAGAASSQWVFRGDAFVEFSAPRTDRAQALGFTELPSNWNVCTAGCPDTDTTLSSMGFAVILNYDARIYLVVRGTILNGPDVGSFGTYAAGERFRVDLHDKSDGSADVFFSRVVSCNGGRCNLERVYTHTGAPARYPIRVDASMRDPDGRLDNVRIMRIK